MGRAPCCDKADVKKGSWSPEEDLRLKQYIEKNGNGGNWISLPHKAGLKRCGKSCRLRWLNYLQPNIKHGGFSDEEDRIIWTLFSAIGSKWSFMAAQLPGRTDNDIKNHWNTKLKKKLMAMASNSSLLKPSDPRFAPLSFHRPVSVSFAPVQALNTLMTSAHYFHSDGSFTQFSHGGSAEIKQEEMGFTLNNNAIPFHKNPNKYIYSRKDNPLHQLISSSNMNNTVGNIDSLMIMQENKKIWVGKV